MCFQGFVYFACGHQDIIESDCDLSIASQNPFYLKCGCVKYKLDHSSPPGVQCGRGRFYCSKSADGPFLDHASDEEAKAAAAIADLNIEIAKYQAAYQRFVNWATQHYFPKEAWPTMPQYVTMAADASNLMQRRKAHQKTQVDARSIMEQARAYHQRKDQHRQSGGGDVFPPFVPAANSVSRVPAEFNTQSNAPQQAVEGSSVAPSSASNSYWEQSSQPLPIYNPFAAQQPIQMPPSPASSHIAAAPMMPYATSTSTMALKASKVAEEQRTEAQSQHLQSISRRAGRPRKFYGNDEAQSQSPKPKGRRRLAQQQEDVQDDAEAVRRSARVRSKINYAESAGSDAGSREPSPDKNSDVSGFSPAKSDVSVSLSNTGSVQRKSGRGAGLDSQELRRSSSSLVDKLSDYKRMTTMAGPGTPMQRREMPVMRDLLNSSPAQSTMPPANITMPPPISFNSKVDTWEQRVDASNAQARALAANSTQLAQAQPSYLPYSFLHPIVAIPNPTRMPQAQQIHPSYSYSQMMSALPAQHQLRPMSAVTAEQYGASSNAISDRQYVTGNARPQALSTQNALGAGRQTATPRRRKVVPPGTQQSRTQRPNAYLPNAFQPNAFQPNAFQPNFSQLHTYEPDVYQPTPPSTSVIRGLSVPSFSPQTPASGIRSHGRSASSGMASSGSADVFPQPPMTGFLAPSDVVSSRPTRDIEEYGVRKDSGTPRGDYTDLQGRQHSSTNDTYDSMRRSLSSTTALTPTTHVEHTPASLEPRKRDMPTSSPTPTSNKRMRLSLPDEEPTPLGTDDTHQALDQSTGTTSSSHQEPPQNEGFLAGEALDFGLDLAMPTTPAPALPATTTTHSPAEDQGALGAEALDESADAGQDVGAEGEDDEQGLDLFTDINWEAEDNDLTDLTTK